MRRVRRDAPAPRLAAGSESSRLNLIEPNPHPHTPTLSLNLALTLTLTLTLTLASPYIALSYERRAWPVVRSA